MSELTIVIPAYNEAESLGRLLPEVIRFCQRNNYELIVVNDGSGDDSAEVLKEFEASPGFSVVTHKVNRGYGGAVKSGIRQARTRYVITIDADGQHDLEDVAAMHREIVDHDADMIVGDRSAHRDPSMYRGAGKTLIRWFARLLMPVHIKDINSGIKICDSELARRYLPLCPDHMAFSDVITLVFINQRRLVLERPVNVRPRLAGISTINTLTAIETVREILNIVVLFNPMRVFFPIALLCVTGSLLWGIPIVLAGRGVSIGALLGFITGLLLFFFGLLAEQLSQIRKNLAD
jgi:glycosyltransferase involved in cell wall biosynthesis